MNLGGVSLGEMMTGAAWPASIDTHLLGTSAHAPASPDYPVRVGPA